MRRVHIHAEVTVIDGRGGDGGRDIVINDAGQITVLQLKYFPEGFSGGHIQRRQQIRRSFKAALADNPHHWKLVVPSNLTPSEQKFVRGLPAGKSRPRVGWIGRAELDDLMADHPALAAYFTREDSIEKAKIYNREVDVLTNPQPDLFRRMGALAQVIDGVDPDWTLDFSRSGRMLVQTLRAQHPKAHETSPITLKVTPQIAADDQELAAAYERVLGYGTAETLEIPFSRFEVDGPPLVAATHEEGFFRIYREPTPTTDRRPIELVMFGGSGDQLSSHTGHVTDASEAARGRSLVVTFHDRLTITFLMPFDQASPGSAQISIDLVNVEPIVVRRIAAVLNGLKLASSAQLRVDGQVLTSIDLTSAGDAVPGASQQHWDEFCSLAEDLDEIQRECDVYFPMPDEWTVSSRIYVRVVRLLLAGHCVVLPGMKTLTATLHEGAKAVVDQIASGSGALMVDQDPFALEIFGHTFTLGHARIYAGDVQFANSDEARTAIDSGDYEGFKLQIVPRSLDSFWTYLVDRLVAQGDEVLKPVPWGLDGIDDPPDALRDDAGD